MKTDLKSPIFFNGNHEHVSAMGGPGDSEGFRTEARFLAYYSAKIAEKLSDPDIVCASISDGVKVRSFGFPGGYYGNGGRICGFEADAESQLDTCLEELDWRNL